MGLVNDVRSGKCQLRHVVAGRWEVLDSGMADMLQRSNNPYWSPRPPLERNVFSTFSSTTRGDGLIPPDGCYLGRTEPQLLKDVRIFHEIVGDATSIDPSILRMATSDDLDNCIKWSATQSRDSKTSGRQLRGDAPVWFAQNRIRPVNQEDMGARLKEKHNEALRRNTGKRRG